MAQESGVVTQSPIRFGRRAGRGTWPGVILQFSRRKPLAALGALIVLVFGVAAILAPLLASASPTQTVPADKWMGLGGDHLLGADHLGRDIYSRVLYGGRVSFFLGFGGTIIAALLATSIGLAGGYYTGWFDTLLQRLMDIAMAFPALVLLATLTMMLPEPGADWDFGLVSIDASGQTALYIAIILGVLFSFRMSRVIRSAVLTVTTRQYIEAARASGASDLRIILQHVLPNIMATLIVLVTVSLGSVILVESSLAFLGFGLPPTIPSWGQMLNEARPGMLRELNPSIWPGLAIALTVWGFNMLGDGLRDVLDPRLRGR